MQDEPSLLHTIGVVDTQHMPESVKTAQIRTSIAGLQGDFTQSTLILVVN